MKRRTLFAVLVSVVLTASLWVPAGAHAQTTITNVSQFSSAFDQPGLFYPLVFPYEPLNFSPMDTWFLDFTALTNAVGAVTNYPGQTDNGVTTWPLRLIQAADTGEVVLKYAWTNECELLRIGASTDFVPFQGYKAALWSSCILAGWNAYSDLIANSFPYLDPPNYEALIADGLTFLDPPRVVMDVWAISAADDQAYSTNGATGDAEDGGAGRVGMLAFQSGMMLMATDPCTIANDGDPFAVTDITPDADGNMVIQWQSCSDHQYEVQAAPALSPTQTMPPFLWSTLTTMCGNDGTTSYTDEDSWLFDQRFYRVRRLASTPPTISCPSNVTVECGQSIDPGSTGTATASEPCHAAPTVTFTDDISGGCPQIITRTWEATDDRGDSVTCIQTITVRDTTPPTITCPPDKQLQCGDSTAPANTGIATATDNCDPNVTVGYTDVATPANCTGQPGIDRTWTATDTCGNSSACVQHITFVDTTAPHVTVPVGGNLGCNPAALPTDASVKALVTATDNCSAPVVNVSHVDANDGSSVMRTFTATAVDGCGNASPAQTVVYTWTADTTPPSITCSAPVTVQCPSSVPPADLASVIASDNSGAVTVTLVGEVVTDQTCANNYTILRTYKAVDACGNNSTCTQTITVNDTTAPTITCPPDVTVNTDLGESYATGVNLGSAGASDNCGAVSVSNDAPTQFGKGTNLVVWTATDACGNSATCTQMVIVVDNERPIISCPPDQTVSAACGAPVNFTCATATDNCPGVTVTCNPPADSVLGPGAHTITATATDASGNTSTCTFTVTVLQSLCVKFEQPPLQDENDCGGSENGEDPIANKFKAGQTIPVKVHLYDCNGNDVTTTIGSSVIVKLDVTERANYGTYSTLVVDITEFYNGVGDAGGRMVLNGNHFQYNLDTSGWEPNTTSNNRYFDFDVKVYYNSSPTVAVGDEDAAAESTK